MTRLFKRSHSLILSVILTSVPLCSSAQDVRKVLVSYFADVRAGKHQAIPQRLLLPAEAATTLGAVGPYLTDTASVVRSKAYAIVHEVGSGAREESLRKDAVAKLIQGVKD